MFLAMQEQRQIEGSTISSPQGNVHAAHSPTLHQLSYHGSREVRNEKW